VGSGFESRGVYQTGVPSKSLKLESDILMRGHPTSTRTELGRLKKSHDLITDKPG